MLFAPPQRRADAGVIGRLLGRPENLRRPLRLLRRPGREQLVLVGVALVLVAVVLGVVTFALIAKRLAVAVAVEQLARQPVEFLAVR
jgi:hypothetical protein